MSFEPSTSPESPSGVGELIDEFADPENLPVTTGYRIANQVAGALVTLLGGGMTAGGLSLGLTIAGVPGPGLFPTIIGSGMFALGITLFVLASMGRLDRSFDTEVPDRAGVRRIIITSVATGVFLWALLWIGYPLAMSLYVLALLRFVGDRKWLNSAIIAVVFGFGSWAGFSLGLGLPLPGSALPFLQAIGL